jgi:hypothetical protein
MDQFSEQRLCSAVAMPQDTSTPDRKSILKLTLIGRAARSESDPAETGTTDDKNTALYQVRRTCRRVEDPGNHWHLRARRERSQS